MTKPVTTHEIQQILKDFKNNKAPGESKINKVLLLNLPIPAIKRYRDIINLTISMGYFPIIFKNGLIILIPKPGKDPRNPINYRPITLLEVPGKILEKIINTRVHKFCERNNIFHEHQYGFRAGRGTDTAITKIYETVAINQKYKDHCNIICRDVSKAFDKVWTSGLKYKIITIEDLPSIIKKIMCSYLVERTAQIKIENIIGPRIKLKSGVPQGGILSPTMYILYTKDIPRPGRNCMDVLFADDITQVIVNYNDDRRQLALTSQREIERINQFEKEWKINTNINKFNILSISKSRPEAINIEGRRVPFSNEIKMLGLTIKRTGVSQHITNRIKQAKAQSTKLKRFIRLDPSIKLHLYKALIRPVMEYPIIPNGITSDINMIKMQRVQNKNLKFVAAYTAQQHFTIEDLHKYYEIDAMNVRLYKAAKKYGIKWP